MDNLDRIYYGAKLLDNGCWQRSLKPHTNRFYAYVSIEGQPVPLHCAVYKRWVGPIPEGYEVDHKCFNKKCFNPEHLEAVTPSVNQLRSVAHQRAKVAHRTDGTPDPEYLAILLDTEPQFGIV